VAEVQTVNRITRGESHKTKKGKKKKGKKEINAADERAPTTSAAYEMWPLCVAKRVW
jgi:hypothetical protein